MRRPHPQSHVTLRHYGHLTNKKRYISTFIQCLDPKFSWVMTQDVRNPPIQSCGTSIVWSRDKSKVFCLYFQKAQGPQTQQDGDQNEKTPHNMSCATPSHCHVTTIQQHRNITHTVCYISMLVGSVNLLHFQLKLSPKNRQISNGYDNTENVQIV